MNKKNMKQIAEDDNARSKFIYDFLQKEKCNTTDDIAIPKVIMQYWHSSKQIPKDVLECIESWKILTNLTLKSSRYSTPKSLKYCF